ADARLKARAPDPAGDGAASDDEGPLGFSRATDGTSRAHDHADLVPVPLTADVWSSAVFHRKVTRDDLVAAIVSDRQASFLCHGRLAYLYATIGQLGPARRAFALGLWMPNAAVRAERFKALATDGVAAFREWHIRSLPFGRAGYDLGLLLSRVEAGDDGTPAEPASR